MPAKTPRFAVIIPVYNHAPKVADVVRHAKRLGFPLFVVNDGATDDTPAILAELDGITVLDHPRNLGKGAALLTGFQAAAPTADFAVTIDADGQHDPEDARNLMSAIGAEKRPLVVGSRLGMQGVDVPWTSRFGRKFSNFWVRVSGGPRLSDTQSGFRIYPLPEALDLGTRARRYQFEVEILVRAARQGIEILEAPIRVDYHPGMARISHFRPFLDFCRNSRTFAELILERIFPCLRSREPAIHRGDRP